jgi:trk system potassium uptake protein
MPAPKTKQFSPGRILLISFAVIILVGTTLLSMPQARVVDISFIDLLFTSASATCVTGLTIVPISYFTFFGKCIILGLIQVGGLGLMTLSFFFVSLFLNLGMATKFMAGQILEFEFWGKVRNFLIMIIGVTFGIELIGALLLYLPFRQNLGPEQAMFAAIFHSISAFCNAGICLYENNVMYYSQHSFLLLVISVLVFAGGIGFIVWYELANFFKSCIKKLQGEEKVFHFSLHTKIVLITSVSLILIGTFFIWGIEQHNTLKGMDTIKGFINSFFISTTLRSAGFSTFRVDEASLATLLIFLILMFIGGSPSSAAGGIKTTTFVLFLATVTSMAKGKSVIEIGGRTIPIDQIYKATVIIASATAWVFITTFILLLTDQSFSFIQILFESISAFTTVGLSTGITPHLSAYGKTLLLISMIVGRIGSLTLVLAIRRQKEKDLYRYPEERIILG